MSPSRRRERAKSFVSSASAGIVASTRDVASPAFTPASLSTTPESSPLHATRRSAFIHRSDLRGPSVGEIYIVIAYNWPVPTTQSGFFEQRARRSARNAIIRNMIFSALIVPWIVFWLVLFFSGQETPAPAVLIVELALVSLLVWRILVAIQRYREPTKHPIFHDFARFGDPLALTSSIERELASGEARRIGDVILDGRFLIVLGLQHAVIELDEIAWVYPKSTRHSVNLVPLGTTTSLELYSYSKGFRFTSLTLTSDVALFDALRTTATRARFGFSIENEAWWSDMRVSLATRDAAIASASTKTK